MDSLLPLVSNGGKKLPQQMQFSHAVVAVGVFYSKASGGIYRPEWGKEDTLLHLMLLKLLLMLQYNWWQWQWKTMCHISVHFRHIFSYVFIPNFA